MSARRNFRWYRQDNSGAAELTTPGGPPKGKEAAGMEGIARALADQGIELDDELGRGQWGRVFRGRFRGLPAAVKVWLHRDLSWARREAALAARVGVPRIHQVGEVDGLPYVVMDLLEGETLASRLSRGPLEEAEHGRLARDLAQALAVVHRRGIVHRDLKPANVHLGADGRARLLDFGLAGTESPGTAAYSSPEQASLREIDWRSDLFSLGALLREARPDSALEPLICRLLAEDPGQRPASASEVLSVLEPDLQVEAEAVVVVGRPGSGKSRMAARLLRGRPGWTIRGIPGAAPYQGLRQLLPALPDAGYEERLQDGALQYQEQVFLALRERFERDRPEALLLEDFHWIDGQSQELLARLRPALRVATVRPGSPAPWNDARILTLEPLDVGRLAAEELGGQLAPKALALLSRLSDGSPLMLLELLDSLLAEGQLVPHWDGWCLAVDPDRLTLPQDLSEAVKRRAGRLTPDCRRLISMLALLREPFDPSLFGGNLDEAFREGLLAREGHFCRFIHDEIRQALAEDQPEHHLKLAQALPAGQIYARARHFWQARELAPVEASLAAAAAGEQAVRDRAYAEASVYFDRAGGQGAEAGLAYLQVGRLEDARRALRHALERESLPSCRARLHSRLARVEAAAHQTETARYHIQQGLEQLGRSLEDRRLLVLLSEQMGQVTLLEKTPLLSLGLTARAARAAWSLGPGPERAALLGGAALVTAALTGSGLARRLARAAHLQAGTPAGEAVAFFYSHHVEHLLGSASRAHADFVREFPRHRAWLDTWRLLALLANALGALLLRGQMLQARRLAQEVTSLPQEQLAGHPALDLADLAATCTGAPSPTPSRPPPREGPLASLSLVARVGVELEKGELGAEWEHLLLEFERLNPHPERTLFLARTYYILRDYGRLEQCFRRGGPPPWQSLRLRFSPTQLVHRRVQEGIRCLLAGRMEQAERVWTQAELEARADENAWALGEIARWRARSLRNEAGRWEARRAYDLATRLGWHTRALSLAREFNEGQAVPPSEPRLHGYLEAMLRLNRVGADGASPAQMARAALNEVARATGAERAVLFLDGLREAARYPADSMWGHSRSLVEEVWKTGQARIRSAEGEQTESVADHQLRSLAALPVEGQEGRLGVVYLDTREALKAFSEHDLSVLALLVRHLASALDAARAREALAASRERFRKLFLGAAVGIALTDRAGCVVEWNPALEELLGSSELDGKPFSAWLHHEDRHLAAGDVRFLRADGSLRWGRVTSTSVPEGAIRTLSDVSLEKLEQLATFQEQERQLLATELHDGLAQSLAALVLRLRLEGSASVDLCKDLADDLSRVMFDLRNPVLEGLDLREALESFTMDLEARLDLPSDARIMGLPALFACRLFQESLNNVRRHAQASRVEVRLALEPGLLLGSVQDDGCGFEPEGRPSGGRGYGLRGMRLRVGLAGGELSIASAPGRGTRVEFRLPCP